MSETSPGYDAGAGVSVAGNGATAPAAAPDDHFESAAQATLSQWAALRRALERANEVIDQLRAENAESAARIGELVRANAQLSENLADSQAREGEAREQAGWLKGIMTSAAGALMEGMAAPRAAMAEPAESRGETLRRLSQRRSEAQ